MIITCISTVINILLDYILIFGKCGLPALGIVGAGIATLLSHVLVLIIYACLIFRVKYRKEYRIHRIWQFDTHIFMKLIKFGIPEGFHFFVDIAGFSAFIFFIGSYGSIELAASNIVIFVDMMAFMPMVGIGIATSILVGQYIGKNRKDISIIITNNSMKITAIYGTCIGLLFCFFPHFFLHFFKGNDEADFSLISSSAIPLFHILPFFLMADSLHIIFGSALSGTGDTKFKMVIAAVLVFFLFIPGEFLILKSWKLPVSYGWWWSTLYLFLTGVIYFVRFRMGQWKKIDMLSQ
jgi:MATE family multidrug resistance protein